MPYAFLQLPGKRDWLHNARKYIIAQNQFREHTKSPADSESMIKL